MRRALSASAYARSGENNSCWLLRRLAWLPRWTVGKLASEIFVEARHREVDVAIILGRVDQPLLEQGLTDGRERGRLLSGCTGHIACAVRAGPELGHRAHVASLGVGRALHPHLVHRLVKRRLRSWLGALYHLERDRRVRGEVPSVLAQLLDVEGVAGGPLERRGDGVLVEADVVGFCGLHQRSFGILL